MKQVVKKLMILTLSTVLALMTFMTSLIGVNATMQPIEEIRAFLVLSDFSEDEIKNFSVDRMISMLRDKDGNSIPIPDDAKVIWTYYKDSQNNIIRDEYHEINRNDIVDLSIFSKVPSYRLELIIGESKQLNMANLRFLVKVFIAKELDERIDFELYKQDEAGNRFKTEPSTDRVQNNQLADIFGAMTVFIMHVDGHKDGDNYYLGIHSDKDDHPDLELHIYNIYQYIAHLTGKVIEEPTEMTQYLLNQDMKQTDAGYQDTFLLVDNVNDVAMPTNRNYLVFEYVYTGTGEVESTSLVAFVAGAPEKDDTLSANIYSFDGETESEAFLTQLNEIDIENLVLNNDYSYNPATEATFIYNYMLKEGLNADDDYYVYLERFDTVYGDQGNSHIIKAVEGIYEKLEDTENVEDIKDYLIPSSKQTVLPFGYKTNCNYVNDGGKYFTLFCEDGQRYVVNIRWFEYDPAFDPYYMKEFTEDPIVGERDPWFRVTGLMLDGRVLPTYVIENGKAINMDTYYGYGYQTIMIDDYLDDDDKQRLVPIFEVADPDRLRVSVVRNGTQQELTSGKTSVDFSNDEIESIDGTVVNDKGLVHLVVDFDDGEHLKNYQLRVISKEYGPKLYVYDDHKEIIDGTTVRSREVLLTDYFENKHDILIANIGDQPLTGVSVTLEPIAEDVPMNVKLDEYWTIGGENNSILPKFKPAEEGGITDKSAYGMIQNVAKVRLLPDGDGDEINAKLVISADGQEDIIVYLTNKPRQPKILFAKLPDGVKYVPYSAYIITDNMYDWNPQSFTIEGTLPEGLRLIANTGEIYGVPKTADTFTFKVIASFGSEYFEDVEKEVTLVINDNTDSNVYEASDGTDQETNVNYKIKENGEIGTEEAEYLYVVDEAEAYEDQVFVSNGDLGDFVDLWLNGEPLVYNTDYTYDSGSTIITIKGQTFGERSNRGKGETGRNTIAMEFRNKKGGSKTEANPETGDHSKDLRRTAQNYYIYSKAAPVPVLPQNVTLRARVIDENDKPIANANLELHSTVKYATTNTDGYASFSAVEFGAHTIYVKDTSNNSLGSQTFTLVEGNTSSVNGNMITAPRGASVNLTVKINSKTHEATIESVDVVDTADHNHIGLWAFILSGSLLIGAAAFVLRRRRA